MFATISAEQIKQANDYANNKSIVKYSNETTYNSRVREQSLTGKLGEFGVYNLLNKLYTISPPDCKIYETAPNTSDLLLEKTTGVEVKTTTLTNWNNYNQSWIIDNLGTELVALTIINNSKVYMKALLPAKTIKKYQKRALYVDKPVIYYTDLPEQKYINNLLNRVREYESQIQKL